MKRFYIPTFTTRLLIGLWIVTLCNNAVLLGAIITVTSTGDQPAFDRTICPNIGPDCTDAVTLRSAIQFANANPGLDTIIFAIPSTDPGYQPATDTWIIKPLSNLPTIADQIIIDGYTQIGLVGPAQQNTNSLDLPNNAIIKIQLDGPGPVFIPFAPTALRYGLRFGFNADGSLVQGLSITNWAAVLSTDATTTGAGIRFDSSSNTVQGCFLGATPGGDSAPNLSALVDFGDSNIIGWSGMIEEEQNTARNLISGQYTINGVIDEQGTNTLIQGNTIGLNVAGDTALMPDAAWGVNCFATVGTKILGNVIAGHSIANILVTVNESAQMLIQGNLIGTDITGSTDVQPNGVGIFTENFSVNGLPSNLTIDSNIISGNTYGINVGYNAVSDLSLVGMTITNNTVGLDVSATTAIPNVLDGIWVKFGVATYINSNVIAGNGRHGIRLCKSQLSAINGNWIGTNPDGADLGNGGDGIFMGGPGVGIMSYGDIIGGGKALATFGPLGLGNIITFNKQNGIETVGFVQGATIDGNFISNNVLNGILLNKNASQNVIGSFKSAGSLRILGELASTQNVANPDSALGGGNTIIANGANGIKVLSADHNQIKGNVIVENPGAGVALIDASHNLVGEKDPGSSVILPPLLNIPNPLGNIITNNEGFGVGVIEKNCKAIDNTIISNSIVDNGCNGIGFVRKNEDSTCYTK